MAKYWNEQEECWEGDEETAKPALWVKKATKPVELETPIMPALKKSQGKHVLTKAEQLRGALRGARKGGLARRKLDPAKLSAQARKAALAMWAKKRQLTKGSL